MISAVLLLTGCSTSDGPGRTAVPLGDGPNGQAASAAEEPATVTGTDPGAGAAAEATSDTHTDQTHDDGTTTGAIGAGSAALPGTHPFRWSTHDIAWSLTASVPADARLAVQAAPQVWNDAAVGMRFVQAADADLPPMPADCGAESLAANRVAWGPVDGPAGLLAATNTCVRQSTGEAISFHLQVDADETWDTGTDTSPNASAYDLLGVLVHEFGHATMWEGHAPLQLCRHDPATMCTSTSPGDAAWRTLTATDIETVRAVYGS